MIRAILLLLFLVPTLSHAKAPESRQQATDVYSLLDDGKTEELKKLSVKELYEGIKKGRTFARIKPLENKRKLVDRHDRETDLYLIVPRKPTGVIFVLHGLGGDGRQLKDRLFKKFAEKEGLIIAAPTAHSVARA